MAEIQSHPAATRPNSNPRENVCLCPASPKIPRPRNSFILFRQHQQSSIIAQNPGIPNPQVSKIIGEQWRGLSAEAKEEWNLLAEEEKARHQQQYPGYRYHPRRNGRASNQSSISGPSSAEPQEPCAKCGGKPMNYYSNPTPVYTPPVSVAQQPMAVTVPAKRGYVVSAGPGGQRISPEHAGFQRVDPRLVYAVPPPGQTIPTPPSAESQDAKRRRLANGVYIPARDVYPEATYSYAHSPTTNGGYVRQEIVHHPSQIQHVQVPKPQMVSPPRAYPRPPPLQPIRPPLPQHRNRSSVALPSIETMVSQTPTKVSAGQFQGSGVEAMVMSIPVLNKIKVLSQLSGPLPAPGIASPKPEVRGAIIAVEGMDATSVNSMTNSLAEQLEKEGKFAVRVFEGPDPYAVLREARTSEEKKRPDAYLKLMTQWHALNREMVEYISSRPGGRQNSSSSLVDNHDTDRRMSGVEGHEQPLPAPDKVVRIDAPQQSESTKAIDADKLDSAISPKTMVVEPASKSTTSSQPGHKGRSLSTPGLWTSHESSLDTRPPAPSYTRPPNSRRIPPPPPTPSPATPPPPPSSVSKPLPRVPPMPNPSSTPSSTTILPPPPPPTTPLPSPSNTAIPIAIVPHFQLTTVDACSISMAIGDNFSPPAHWQWFATMWRGSVGPDITIVIRGVEEDAAEGEIPKPPAAALPGIPGAPNAAGNAPAARERLPSVASSQSHSGGTGVEIRLHDSRAVIVKTGIANSMGSLGGSAGEEKAGGKAMTPVQQAKEMENWEKAKRRVGFEVEEFLRR
ncbi:slightly ste11-like protein [Cladophialophora chaetospira]|uniref:Slightly ste11-like protein n=1 Tax=Cladophialophora chaetospira TaxID=386627 RepID=A0AA39CH78_9EURO|nr:slightly ste11-like protein [Cladophialophora chaetospira]